MARQSEREAWEDVREAMYHIKQLVGGSGSRLAVNRRAAEIASNVISLSLEMQRQVESGVHTNPPLVIWPNPPGGEQISSRVYELAYRHDEDGQDYKHQFSPGVDLFTVTQRGRRIVVLSRPDGRKLWDDF